MNERETAGKFDSQTVGRVIDRSNTVRRDQIVEGSNQEETFEEGRRMALVVVVKNFQGLKCKGEKFVKIDFRGKERKSK